MIDGCSFDFIMSLGGSCATAKQLSFCGLRQRSLPFDWLFHLNNQTLDYLIEGFSNGFDHWMFINDMRPLEEGERGNSNCFQYHDNATGYNTIHDFHNEIHNLSEYDSVKQKYKRRFDRLEHYLSKAHTALFVLDARYDVDILKLKKIKNVVESKHPDLVLSILLMQFISVKEDMYEADGIKVIKYTRNHTIDDYNGSPKEWDVLKTISINNISFFSE